jgi:hypothetical protein
MASRPQPTRRQRWTPYVRQLADILHLRDWQIEIYDDSPSDGDALASCQPVSGRKLGIIRLAESFLTDEPAAQRHTLTHELLHCHFGPPWRMLEAHNALPPAALMAMEYGIDGVADAIAPLLPLPPAATRSQH